MAGSPARKATRRSGPSHFETFDPKPDTGDSIRGPYGAIRTSSTGVQFSELMPMMAQRMNRCAVIRSLTHRTDSHSPIPMLTGFNTSTTSYGAVVANLWCLPLADKLHLKLAEEEINRTLIIDGVLMIREAKSPTLVREMLLAYLPERHRHTVDETEAETAPA